MFGQNVIHQMTLEFGSQYLQVSNILQRKVADDLLRVEADVQYRRPGVDGPSHRRVVGWVSRCNGTTIVRGNTWLADGTLSVPRYSDAELTGSGITLGNPDAPTKLLAYIDSRCPNCHRLIAYAQDLVKEGKLFIEFRQVAYLEDIDESLSDTRLFDTRLVRESHETPVISDERYLELVGGFASEERVNPHSPSYIKAKKLLQENTRVARKVLYLGMVPGVLIREKEHGDQFRLMGYWEMNRLMQPDL